MKRTTGRHVVRDAELALVLMAAVAVAFALMLGAVAPAASGTAARAVPTDTCKRDEPGLANPAEPPTLDASCRSGQEASLRTPGATEHAGSGRHTSPTTRPWQAIPPARTDIT